MMFLSARPVTTRILPELWPKKSHLTNDLPTYLSYLPNYLPYLPYLPNYLPYLPNYLPYLPNYLPYLPNYLPYLPNYLPYLPILPSDRWSQSLSPKM
jgi:hypothetical protein